MRRPLPLLFYFVILLALIQAGWHYAHLPARIATHFDLAGRANGWMPRNGYLAFQIGLLLFLGLVFGGLGRLMRRLPDRLINLPYRDYWLAPARREQTLRWVDNLLHGLGIAAVVFAMLLFQKVFAANLYGTLQLKMLPLFIGWFVFIICLVILMMSRFQRPDAEKFGRRKR